MNKMMTLAMAVMLANAAAAQAETLGNDFSINPLGTTASTVHGDAGRFSYDSSTHSVVAQYNSAQPTAMLLFPLGLTLTQNQSFSVTTTFTINSITNYDNTNPLDPASGNGTAQLSFGLANSTTTGTNRTDGFSGNAYDLLTADYFPTNNAFGSPSVEGAVVESPEAAVPYYEKIDFPSASNSSLPTFLNTSVPITALLSYDAATHVLTATFTSTHLLADGSGTTFTSTQDLDATSLTYDSDGFKGFNEDSFALTLWDDSSAISAGYDAPFSASVSFQGYSVEVAAAPEPASLGVLMLAGGLLFKRRR